MKTLATALLIAGALSFTSCAHHGHHQSRDKASSCKEKKSCKMKKDCKKESCKLKKGEQKSEGCCSKDKKK